MKPHKTYFIFLLMLSLIFNITLAADPFNLSFSFGTSSFKYTGDYHNNTVFYDFHTVNSSSLGGAFNQTNAFYKSHLTTYIDGFGLASYITVSSQVRLNSTMTPLANTDVGLNFNTPDFSGNSGRIVLVKILDDPISLTNDTEISMYCGQSKLEPGGASASFNDGITFKTGTGVTVLDIPLCSGSPNNCTYTLSNTAERSCPAVITCNVINKTFVNTTIGYLRSKCQNMKNADFSNIQQIMISYANGQLDTTNKRFYLDDLTILGALNGSNSLPSFNITYNDVSNCIPAGSSKKFNATFCFNISASDPEGDQIYYGTAQSNTFNTSYSLLFNVRKCDYLGCYNDMKPLSELDDWMLYPYSETCRLNQSVLFDRPLGYSNTELILYQMYLPVFPTDNRYNLIINGGCTGKDKSVYIKNPQVYNLYQSEWTIFGLGVGEGFNVTLWNADLTQILIKVGMEKLNSTVTYVYNYNINGTRQEVYNLSVTEAPGGNDNFILQINGAAGSTFGISLLNMSGLTSMYHRVMVVDGLNTYQPIISNSLLFKNAQLSVENDTIIALYNYYLNGVLQVPAFSTTVPSCTNYDAQNSAGALSYTVYVSDSVHQPTEYRTATTLFYVTPPGICISKLLEQSDDVSGNYVNINNLVPPWLYVDQAFYMLQFPYRLLKWANLLNYAIGALILVLMIYMGMVYFQQQNFEAAFVQGFLSMAVLMIMKLMYIDLYLFTAFIFSIYLANNITKNITETSDLTTYIRSYLIFTVLVLMVYKSVGSSLFTIDTGAVFSPGILKSIIDLILACITWFYVPVEANFFTMIFANIINVYIIAMRVIIIYIVAEKIMTAVGGAVSKLAAMFGFL